MSTGQPGTPRLGGAVCSPSCTSRVRRSPAWLWVPELLCPALPCVLEGRCCSKTSAWPAGNSFVQGASLAPSSRVAVFPQAAPSPGWWVLDQAPWLPAQRLTSGNLDGK